MDRPLKNVVTRGNLIKSPLIDSNKKKRKVLQRQFCFYSFPATFCPVICGHLLPTRTLHFPIHLNLYLPLGGAAIQHFRVLFFLSSLLLFVCFQSLLISPDCFPFPFILGKCSDEQLKSLHIVAMFLVHERDSLSSSFAIFLVISTFTFRLNCCFILL